MFYLADMNNGVIGTFATREEAEAELDSIIAEHIESEADLLMDMVDEDGWELSPAEKDYEYLSELKDDPENRELALNLAEERIRDFHEITEPR